MAKSSTRRVPIYINGKEVEASVKQPQKKTSHIANNHSQENSHEYPRPTATFSLFCIINQEKNSYLCPRKFPRKNQKNMPQSSTVHCQPSTAPSALHYHSALSLWLSVDPMADKYPGVSPYVYCGNNPVRLVDVDGREIGIPPWFKEMIANSITSVAEYAHGLYVKASQMSQKYPWMLSSANNMIQSVKEWVGESVDMNPNTMSWNDLTLIWLFELGEYGSSNTIRFGANAATTQVLRQQAGVLSAKQLAISNIRAGKFSDVKYQWRYGQKEFYEGISESNIATSFLGTYTTNVSIVPVNDKTYTLKFSVTNTSGWESATRLRRDMNHDGAHDSIIPDKMRGTGIKLGGNLKQIWTWEERITL